VRSGVGPYLADRGGSVCRSLPSEFRAQDSHDSGDLCTGRDILSLFAASSDGGKWHGVSAAL